MYYLNIKSNFIIHNCNILLDQSWCAHARARAHTHIYPIHILIIFVYDSSFPWFIHVEENIISALFRTFREIECNVSSVGAAACRIL